jgi:predicted MFS family arabinose efflux permease
MPLGLWKLPNFAGLWIAGFVMYGGYQTTIYYITLIAQEVNKLSPSTTAIRLIPMGLVGGIFSVVMGPAVSRFNTKYLLMAGMALCVIAPLPCCFMSQGDTNFWKHVFPTSVIGVAGVTITYCTVSIFMLSSVPVNAKSLCGGMVNTAFQIGSGVGLALSSAVVQAVDVKKGHGELKQYETGLWCCVGLAAVGLVASVVGVKSQGPVKGTAMAVH